MDYKPTPPTADQIEQARLDRQNRISAFEANADNRFFRLDLVPRSYKNLFLEIYTNQCSKSVKKIAKAKCLDCVAFDKAEITECTIKRCPLWHVRPYQK